MLLLLLQSPAAVVEPDEDVVVIPAFDWRVEMDFNVLQGLSPAWTNVTEDIEALPMTFSRGTRGVGPEDLVAMPGTLELSLRNDAGNSAGLEGLYSPNHPNCRLGFGFGTPVRVIFARNI